MLLSFGAVEFARLLHYIGDRQVRNLNDASRYIQTIRDNEDLYWIVHFRTTEKQSEL